MTSKAEKKRTEEAVLISTTTLFAFTIISNIKIYFIVVKIVV